MFASKRAINWRKTRPKKRSRFHLLQKVLLPLHARKGAARDIWSGSDLPTLRRFQVLDIETVPVKPSSVRFFNVPFVEFEPEFLMGALQRCKAGIRQDEEKENSGSKKRNPVRIRI